MAQPAQCFFAYSANPTSLSEVFENAIPEINRRSSEIVFARGWRDLGVTGTIIIRQVCDAIQQCELFVCDLTNLSPNVLFELGYAIAKKKRVWITLDASYEEAKNNFDKLNIFRGVGYASYQNSQHLVNLFFRERPYEDLESTIYNHLIQSIVQVQRSSSSLLYLKSKIDTEASVSLSRRIASSQIPQVVDDPNENSSQPLAWYAQNTYYSYAVIAHLLDDERDKKHLQNQYLRQLCGRNWFKSGVNHT